jgi:SAM-dependent methyltransferase
MSTIEIDLSRTAFGRLGAPVWYNQRAERLLTRNRHLIAGRRILDTACGQGQMSYACALLGASEVVGVDARAKLIEDGRQALAEPIQDRAERVRLVVADVFDFLPEQAPGDYDVILVFGWLASTTRQIELFRELGRLRPQTVIIETWVAPGWRWGWVRRPCLELTMDVQSPHRQGSIESDPVVLRPSVSAVEYLLRAAAGYEPSRLDRVTQPSAWIARRRNPEE